MLTSGGCGAVHDNGSRRMTSAHGSDFSLAEREDALALRQAELERRETELHAAAAQRLANVVELERKLEQALAAVEAQRERLEAVRAGYESGRAALARRAREVKAERDHLRAEQADVVARNLRGPDTA